MKNITIEKLHRIKNALPAGSLASIAKELNIDEQTVRNYFGTGPQVGIVHLEDDTILNRALQILGEKSVDNIIANSQAKASPQNPGRKKKEDVFKKMESLRKRLQTKMIPGEVDISALANEVNL